MEIVILNRKEAEGMKKLLAVILMGIMMLSICACGNDNADSQGSENKKPGSEVESTVDTDKDKTSESEDDGKIAFTVKVVDENGNPIANVYVQLCDDAMCYMPAATDANGVATFRMAEGSYKAALSVPVTGYVDVTGQYFEFEGDATEVTITLQKAA